MYYTTDAHIDRYLAEQERAEAQAEALMADLDAAMPWWETAEQESLMLTEGDFPLYDDTLDALLPSDDDWAAFIEDTYVDPAEREW